MELLHQVILNTTDNYSSTLTTFVNLYSYKVLRRYTHIYSEFDNIHLDGIALQFLFIIFHQAKIPRISFDFTSMAGNIFSYAEAEKKSIFFIGSKQRKIVKAVYNIRTKYHNLNILGFRNGYFDSEKEYLDTINHINRVNPDIVIAGLGTPLQEILLLDLRKKGWKGAGFTCGGFLHQTAVKSIYYPGWINKLNLRWLYRIYDEPRLIKRYIIDYPIGIIYFIKDFIIYKRKVS